MKNNKMKTGEGYLHTARESAPITCILAETERQAEK